MHLDWYYINRSHFNHLIPSDLKLLQLKAQLRQINLALLKSTHYAQQAEISRFSMQLICTVLYINKSLINSIILATFTRNHSFIRTNQLMRVEVTIKLNIYSYIYIYLVNNHLYTYVYTKTHM